MCCKALFSAQTIMNQHEYIRGPKFSGLKTMRTHAGLVDMPRQLGAPDVLVSISARHRAISAAPRRALKGALQE